MEFSRVAIEGGAPEKIGVTLNGQLKGPNVSPDGRRLVYTGVENKPPEVWMFENLLPAPTRASDRRGPGTHVPGLPSRYFNAPASNFPTSAPPDFVTKFVSTGTALPTMSGDSPRFENADAALARPLAPPVA